jgi:hypothetical protein
MKVFYVWGGGLRKAKSITASKGFQFRWSQGPSRRGFNLARVGWYRTGRLPGGGGTCLAGYGIWSMPPLQGRKTRTDIRKLTPPLRTSVSSSIKWV